MTYTPPYGQERYALVREASNPATLPERLLLLANEADPAIRASVLLNDSTPAPLAQFIADAALSEPSWVLRQAIARCSKLEPPHYRKVGGAREWYVCIQLVENHQCPVDLLQRFARDKTDTFADIRKRARERLLALGIPWDTS